MLIHIPTHENVTRGGVGDDLPEMRAIDIREHAFYTWLKEVADILNDALDDYRVSYTHQSGGDFLQFEKVSQVPRELSYEEAVVESQRRIAEMKRTDV